MIGGVARKAHFFVFDLPHSDACYVRAYPAATAEAWIDGHVHAFAFFGGVPQSVLYDNDRCLVSRILADGTRRRHGSFVSTAAGICTGAAAQKCTTGSVVACPRSPWEGPARGATRPRRGWRRPARGRGLWAHGVKRGVIRTVAGVVTGSA